VLSASFLFHAGCGKDHNRPADLPKLYPANITVTQEGNLVEEATVTLISKTPSKYNMSSATTNASGVAILRTYGFNGVPAGVYTVTVSKTSVEGAREVTNEYGESVTTGGKLYQYVDHQYTDEASTPFSITVSEKGIKETFEVGVPVRVFLMDIPGL